MDFKNSTIEEMSFNLINSTISVKETFVDLIQQNKISLYRLSKSILKNEADVEDAISETILKAYKSIDNLKSFDSFKPWLMKILVNECYSILRQHKKIELQEDFSDCTGSYEDNHGDGLMVYVERLEENFKAVVILFYYEDLSIKDISKILKVAFIAATISTVLATTTVMAATPEVRNLVGSVISYFNNNDTRYSADKTNFEKFNKAVGVSSYDKNIKFTVNNIAVDDNFINVFLTIESKNPVSINKTGKDELFESQFSTPFLDFKVNGKTLKASNNNDNDAYFENGKRVLKSMVRFNVSQLSLPETFNLEISTNNICNVKGTWKIQTSVDKSKVLVNSKTVKPNINKTISINGIQDELAIDKVLISHFGNQIVVSEKNSRGTINPFALFDDRGISLDILNTDTVGPINGKSTNSFEFLKANLNTKYIDLVPINYLNYEGSKNEIDLEKQPISKLPITFKTSTIGSTIVDKISYDKNSIRVNYHKDGVTLFDPEFEFFDANGNNILDNGGGESTSIDRKDGTYTEILTFVNKTVDFSKVAQIKPIGKMQQLELLKDQKIRIKIN